jgi:hypothetical protein
MTRGCGECHSGVHRPFAEEWTRVEARARGGIALDEPVVQRLPRGEGGAAGVGREIHVHRGIDAGRAHGDYLRRLSRPSRVAVPWSGPFSDRCAVGAAEPVHEVPPEARRAGPGLALPGPHSPEGPLLLGEAGWLPPNFQYPSGALVGSHGSDRNPQLCATCHVTDYQIRDPLTNAFTFRATGHSFQAIPCVTSAGVPTNETSCELTQRSFRSCTGCHLSESAARTALTVAEMRLARLAAEIASLLPRIPASEFSTSDNRYTTAEGSRFNMQLAEKKGSARPQSVPARGAADREHPPDRDRLRYPPVGDSVAAAGAGSAAVRRTSSGGRRPDPYPGSAGAGSPPAERK